MQHTVSQVCAGDTVNRQLGTSTLDAVVVVAAGEGKRERNRSKGETEAREIEKGRKRGGNRPQVASQRTEGEHSDREERKKRGEERRNCDQNSIW